MEGLPETSAPDEDLVEAGLVIRRLAVEHPALFRLVFRNTVDPSMRSQPTVCSSSARAYDALKSKVARLVTASRLEATGVDEATLYFRVL